MRAGVGQRVGPRIGPVLVVAAIGVAGLTACITQGQPPKILSATEAQVTIAADLDSSPKPLAQSHCGKYQKRPVLHDATSAGDNLIGGWATGTKVFIYTFDCR